LTLIKAIAADGAHPFDDVELNLNRCGEPMEQHRLTLTRRSAFAALLSSLGSAAGITTTNASVISAAEATDDRHKPAYHESEHVKTYYSVNRT
jgi:hypothetical protein